MGREAAINVTIDPATRSLHIHVRAALDYPAGHITRLLAHVVEGTLGKLERIETASEDSRSTPDHRGR